VFLDIPMDVQFDQVDDEAIRWPSGQRANRPQGADATTLEEIAAALARSERPMIFAGAGAKGGHENHLQALAEALQAPTYLNSRARGSLPYGHPLLGAHARSAAFAGADLVLALGVDWDFRARYGESVATGAIVIQIDADPGKVGWNRSVDLGVLADPMEVAGQLVAAAERFERSEPGEWTTSIMAQEAASQSASAAAAADDSIPVMPQRFARDVAEFFGSDSIIAVDGGDIVSSTARWLQVSRPGHLLDPGPVGTLGTGAPFAIAAKVAFPDTRVGIVFGDGAFGFNGFEYDTMVRLGLPIIGVMGNDGVWANIKTIHKAFFPDRVVAADLGRRPYHAVVNALGGHGELVTDPAQIGPALERAEASGLPALVDVHIAETVRASSNYAQ
jgi:acetolactate synthase-1/2/3 large subunit